MTAVGLVLSAGGVGAEAWHAGVVAGLGEATGWDARRADLIVGTSAGSVSGLGLRIGISPSETLARIQDQLDSPPDQDLTDQDLPETSSPVLGGARRPQSLKLTARALWPPWRIRPVHAALGLLPPGRQSNETFGRSMDELSDRIWPSGRLWVTAVRLSDGHRVVFGRDDLRATVGQALRASCAVPLRYQPVSIGRSRYIDGGVHSSTNADLVAALAFDLVVISSAMTGQRRAAIGQRMRRCLAGEVADIRRQGTPVLVLEPQQPPVEPGPAGPGAAIEATRRRLDAADGPGFVSLLRRASKSSVGESG